MGYAQAWVAVRGLAPDVLLARLGLRATGRRESFPDAPYLAIDLPSGWYVVIDNYWRAGETWCGNLALKRVSVGCDAVAGSVEERVMHSSLSSWTDGRCNWSILHDSERAEDHLEVVGSPPPPFDEIRSRLVESQRAEDEVNRERSQFGLGTDYVFDVPVELGHAVTGYRHDADYSNVADEPFEILVGDSQRRRPAAAPSLWRRLFGT